MLRSSFNFCYCATKSCNILLYSKHINIVAKNVIAASSLNNNILSRYNSSMNSNKDEHIYTGLLSKQVFAVKVFSLTSSAMGLCFQPIIYQKALETGLSPVYMAGAVVLGFFTFVTPVLLHWITKKYITDIEYDPMNKVYTATVYTFFLTKKKIKFTPDDVEIPDLLGMFTSAHIKNRPVFMELTHFTDPTHYAKIMGYDKPMPFKIDRRLPDDSDPPQKT